MANTNTYHISSVAFPTAEYDDRYISVDQTDSTLEQGFQVNSIAALSGARDSKINNYSAFYMTGRNKLTNFLSVSSLAESQSTSLITKLGFERPLRVPLMLLMNRKHLVLSYLILLASSTITSFSRLKRSIITYVVLSTTMGYLTSTSTITQLIIHLYSIRM